MSNSKFKTAAAKLLAQHSDKKKKEQPPAAQVHVSGEDKPKPVAAEAAAGKQRTAPPAMHITTTRSAGLEIASLIRHTAIPFLALLGCAVMVFIVPETIFGMWFNGLFGLIGGAVFGIILVREIE